MGACHGTEILCCPAVSLSDHSRCESSEVEPSPKMGHRLTASMPLTIELRF